MSEIRLLRPRPFGDCWLGCLLWRELGLVNAAPGLTPRAALQSLSAIQMVEVNVPTSDGRVLVMPRYTEPEVQQKMFLEKLKLTLPLQLPPRIRSGTLELPPATTSKNL